MGTEVFRNLGVFALIFRSFQKIAVSPHPGERLTSAVRAARNHFRGNGCTVSQSLKHPVNKLLRIPRVIAAAPGTLHEAVIALNLADIGLRVKFDELRVLVSRQDVEILPFKQDIQIPVWRTQRSVQRGMKKCGEIPPSFFRTPERAVHPRKGALKMILLRKFSKIFPERRRVRIIKIPSACGGKP